MQVATGQFASTGIVSLTYVQRVSEKVEFPELNYWDNIVHLILVVPWMRAVVITTCA